MGTCTATIPPLDKTPTVETEVAVDSLFVNFAAVTTPGFMG